MNKFDQILVIGAKSITVDYIRTTNTDWCVKRHPNNTIVNIVCKIGEITYKAWIVSTITNTIPYLLNPAILAPTSISIFITSLLEIPQTIKIYIEKYINNKSNFIGDDNDFINKLTSEYYC